MTPRPRSSPRAVGSLAAAVLVAASAPAVGQGVADPVTASLEGPDPPVGVGVPLRVRLELGAAPTPGAVTPPPVGPGARLRDLRLVSPEGASLPVALAEPWRPGARLALRGDLPLAGAWTLSFTLLRPGRRPTPVTLPFTATAGAAAPTRSDPAPPALAASEPAVAPDSAAVTAPGPQPPAGPR